MADGISDVVTAIGSGRAFTPVTETRTYVPRKIHVNWQTMHLIIGVASHLAWKQLVVNGQTGRHALRVPFSAHTGLTGSIAKQIVINLLKSLGSVTVNLGGTKSGVIQLSEDYSKIAVTQAPSISP